MTIIREPGYYWVKNRKASKTWTVARWNGYDWFYCGVEEGWADVHNAVVGPKIEPPT